MTITEAKEQIVKDYMLPNKEVYGVGIILCDGCGKEHIEVRVDKKFDKNRIPKKFKGYRVNTVFGEMAKAQNDSPTLQQATNGFSNEFILQKNIEGILGVGYDEENNFIRVSINENSKDVFDTIPNTYEGYKVVKLKGTTKQVDTIIKITNAGKKEWMSAPITGGYIPETIAVLLALRDGKPHKVSEIKNSGLKIKNIDGVIQYLLSKKYLSTSTDPEFFYEPLMSNAIGFSEKGNYKTNLGRTLGEKFSRNIAPTMYISQPRTIRITQKGFDFLNANKDIKPDNQYYLSYVILNELKDTKPHNEFEVMGNAGIGINDWNYSVNMLRVSGMVYIN